jgi:hypothetical protein
MSEIASSVRNSAFMRCYRESARTCLLTSGCFQGRHNLTGGQKKVKLLCSKGVPVHNDKRGRVDMQTVPPRSTAHAHLWSGPFHCFMSRPTANNCGADESQQRRLKEQ